MRLETERLVLRSFEASDAEAWLELVNDKEVDRYSAPSPPITLADFETVLERRRALERERGHAMLAVELKEGGAFIGQCGIHLADGIGPDIELTFHFLPVAWNKGYGTEAATAVLSHGLETLGIQRVIAFVIPENVGSWRALEKAGMHFVGMTDHYELKGLKQYEVTRDTWKSPQQPAP